MDQNEQEERQLAEKIVEALISQQNTELELIARVVNEFVSDDDQWQSIAHAIGTLINKTRGKDTKFILVALEPVKGHDYCSVRTMSDCSKQRTLEIFTRIVAETTEDVSTNGKQPDA